MDILSKFVMTERFKYADINVFAYNLESALRYYGFLLIILGRYDEADKRLMAVHEEDRKLSSTKVGITRVTPEQGRLMVKSGRLVNRVHLEIESFYLFAKILLDNIARFLYVYFGEEKGIGLKSHDDLSKHQKKYFESKGLVIPEGLSKSITLLKQIICDYRDKEISHQLSLRRTRATAWSGTRGARIVGGMINPRRGDITAISVELPRLMEAINAYIRQIITLIESNRNKCRLRLKATQAEEGTEK